jgi:hypothetical protein
LLFGREGKLHGPSCPGRSRKCSRRYWSTAPACGILENTGTTGDKSACRPVPRWPGRPASRSLSR